MESIKNYVVQITEPIEFSELLHRRGFNVNMRLYNNNEHYNKMIKEIINYMHKALTTYYSDFIPAGISAHNIGVPLNIISFKIYPENPGIMTMINPKIVSKSKEELIRSSLCGSILDKKWYRVKRPIWIEVEYYNLTGEKKNEKYNSYCGTICHEIDHNNGILVSDIAIKE